MSRTLSWALVLTAPTAGSLAQGGPSTSATTDNSATYQCMNPMFRSHWYTGDTDTAQLDPRPVKHHSHLVSCKMWNEKASCCNSEMEAPQQAAFEAHRATLDGQVAMLRDYLTELTEIRASEVYERSDPQDQALFARALDSFEAALGLADGCVRRLLAFAAGMICFGCQPEWSYYVWRTGLGEVLAVKVDKKSCLYVDRTCGAFGRAVQHVYMRVMESELAKRPKRSLPDFLMLANREEMCNWLRTFLAMQPMLPPSKHQALLPSAARLLAGEATSQAPAQAPSDSEQAMMLATALPTTLPPPEAPPGASYPALALDPAADGLLSGFQFDFDQDIHE